MCLPNLSKKCLVFSVDLLHILTKMGFYYYVFFEAVANRDLESLFLSPQITNAGEGMGKRQPSFAADENVNWCRHMESSVELPLETKHRAATWPRNPAPRHRSGGKSHFEKTPALQCRLTAALFMTAKTWKH